MNRHYFFEDEPDSALSNFYKLAYPHRSDIVFVSSVGNLPARVSKFLEKGEDNLALVLMDLVPDNKELEDIYNKLVSISVDADFRCIVLPIVCAEYYYLQALGDVHLWKNPDIVRVCMERCAYGEEGWLHQHKESSYRNFEKFCKLLADEAVYSCSRIPRNGRIRASHKYTIENCICSGSDERCVEERILQEKARAYVKQFPYKPHAEWLGVKQASVESLWEAHYRAVEEFNRWSRRLCSPSKPCFTISPILRKDGTRLVTSGARL